MLERILVAPLPFLDESASGFPIELGHGFSLQRSTKPAWLEQEQKESLFLSRTDVERLNNKEYWLTLPVKGEAAIGKAENDAEDKMKLFLFLATLFSPCHDMFMPSFLVEKSPSFPNGCARQIMDLREAVQLCLPEMFRHNVITLESLRWSSNWLDTCVALRSSPTLTFRIAATLWTVGFKQRIGELQLLFWVMGAEALLGSSEKREFTERLRTLIDDSEPLYQDGTYNRFGVTRDSDYCFKHLWDALYEARGQVAHGQTISPAFLTKVQDQLPELRPPKFLGEEEVPLKEVLIEASCLLLQKLLIAAMQDPRCIFLLEDVTTREQKLRGLVAGKMQVWEASKE